MPRFYLLGFLLLAGLRPCVAQDLLDLLNEEIKKEEKPEYATATFKATRLINGHSIETLAGGVLDVRISHRFGYLNAGIEEFFGLDQATTRLALEYGITNRLMVGIGRSSWQKEVDGFVKYKLLRQQSKGMPVTVTLLSAMSMKTIPYEDPNRENYFSSRLYYAFQGLIARKFTESLSLQLMPSLVHYNLAPAPNMNNDVISLGVGGRLKLTKRVSLNTEYYYQLPSTQYAGTTNAFGIGFDVETGGHVFQLYFTNATGMTERTFISETTGNFFQGDIHFGFHLSRVFTIRDPRKKQ
ncbi:MAG: hypothetical protein JNN04_12335 [Cyclobacteriaceae bacterium]|nr:hypothetical protein [Cyclobacteriaceae bacterium]